jgi:hypothetical protein
MKSYTQNLHNELLLQLEELDKHFDPKNLADSRLAIITTAIDQIKEKLRTHFFSTEADEIDYFKFTLPCTLALYIYYTDKIEWDRIVCQGSPECRYKFHDRIYSRAENFRNDHQVFYSYCRDGKPDLDHLYFLRKSPLNRESQYPLGRIIDASSPPHHCMLLGIMIAYTRLECELKMKVAENKENELPVRRAKRRLRWTGKQSELIELGYGLHEMGSFNNGNVSLNDIFDYFGEVFEVQTGNTSRLFQDILVRKSGFTIYLDQMTKKLLQRINDVLN